MHFGPVQDLHGYSNPWPAGGGKNLFNINATEQAPSDTTSINTTVRIFTPNTYCAGTSYSNWFFPTNVTSYSITNNILSVTSNTGYAVGFAIKVLPETTYFISATITNDGRIGTAYYDAEGNHISGEVNKQNKSFTTPENTDIVVLCFNSPSNGTTVTYTNIQLEKGSAATSYAPYENICPISGWTGCEVYRTGNNLFDGEWEIGSISTATGNNSTDSGSCRIKNYIAVKPGTNIAISWNAQATGSVYALGFAYKSDKSFSRYTGAFVNIGRITLQSDECYIRFYRYQNKTPFVDCVVNYGSTATTYEPYNGTTIPITFPSEAGTVYGGYVDLVKGELVRDWLINTHEIAATDGTPGGTGTGGDTNYRFIAWNLASAHLPDSLRTTQAICNIVPYSTTQGGARFWLGGGTVYMVLPNDGQAYSAIITYAERDLNQSVYQLTPTQLKTLRGTNNIWSNANDNIDLAYWSH